MDETLRELVSRYVDDDLNDAESSRLDVEAETDPEVAAEIDTTRELRTAVRSVADHMEPPAALDRIMEPLCQAPPVPAQRTRPVFRWLGVAAAVVLGVTVATEMARRNPTPSLNGPSPQPNRPVGEGDEIFRLAPLPTAVPNDNRPLGAVDHLLEEDPRVPAAPEPAPLEVIGPLNTAAPSTPAAAALSREGGATADQDKALEPRPEKAARKTRAKDAPDSRADDSMEVRTEAKFGRQGMATEDHRRSKTGASEAGAPSRDQAAGRAPTKAVSVILFIDDVAVWTGSSASCQSGRWPVQIEVFENVVSSIEPVRVGGKGGIAVSCTPESVVGSRLEGVGNGIHRGELLVGEPPK